MRMMPSTNTWRKSLLIYRFVRYRRGFGVHSPFVFHLITKVIEEKCLYYCFYDIELIRKQFLFREERVGCPHRRRKGILQQCAVGEIVRREGIRPPHGALLFRLTNYFKPKHILQVGTSVGFSTLYLTAYAKGLQCITLENVAPFADLARQVFEKAGCTFVDLRVGAYNALLPAALEEMKRLDFVFFNTLEDEEDVAGLFNQCLAHVHNDTVFVCEGIQTTPRMRAFWKRVCGLPEVTVTLDLYSVGIILFNKKLHKRNYIVYF